MLRGALLIATLVAVVALGPLAADPPSPGPHPALSPAEVVRIQLEAMAHNDTPLPNAGIETAFRFASPANREATGPLDRFVVMVRDAPYRSLLDHREARILPPMDRSPHVLVPVRLVAEDGREVRYLFVLTRQEDGEFEGCWMTDAVMPVESGKSGRVI